MAYTIISQNNTTTTLSDENGNVITVPARVTLATSTDYTITKVNNNSVDLEDGDGKIIRGVPACVVLAGEGGGSGGSSLPDQTGHAGEFLTTDGTDASWSDKPLVNTATGSDSLSILGAATTRSDSVLIGKGAGKSNSCASSVIIGSHAANAGVSTGSICIGVYSGPTNNNQTVSGSVAIGTYAHTTVSNAIQISARITNATNSDANTFKVANANGNYEIMSADGTIPADRLASTTGLADGNYRLRLTMSNGTPTLSWVAE